MKKLGLIGLLTFFLINCQIAKPEKSTEVTKDSNPLFNSFNKAIDYDQLTSNSIEEATRLIQVRCNEKLDAIIAVDDDSKTFENTMVALDELTAELRAISSPVYLMSYTHPDSSIRTAAFASIEILNKYSNELSLNEDLYKAIKTYSNSAVSKQLKSYKAKYLKETVDEYERNGFALSKEERERLKGLNNEISKISDEFSKNIAAFEDFLIINETGMEGLPEDFKTERRQADGTYKVDLSYPSYHPFMQYATSDEERKKLYMKYMNRAAPQNLLVLRGLLSKRLEMSNLLGFETYSAYRLADRMAKTPATVWDFETKLKNDLRAKTEDDKKELLGLKKAQGLPNPNVLNEWESSYLNNLLQKEKYQLDPEEVKEYFALDDVLDGLFTITQSLFDLEYREVKNPSVWHEEVRMFEVYQDNKLKGIFYLDLHPRPNKYGHAACFGIKNGRMTRNGYQIPNASLVCNFPKATADKPSLMPHSQVETFFHEFGHVLHQMLTTADLYSQSGTNVARDFVEAPSQIFENWVWDYEAIKLFAKHYKTREVLPKALFDKMLAAKNVGVGISTTRQVFLGTYDLTLHDRFNPNEATSTTDVLKKLQNDILPYPFTEGNNFQAAFGHLTGYGSSYYGYMWSLVYAQDMFSIFDENGILDKSTGLRYRDIILAKGSSEEPLDLVKEFLGREPNNKAFLKELGL
jgi:thimet oligopeptidase